MPTTVYDRLVVFYLGKNVIPLTLTQKPALGKIVAAFWYGSDNAKKDFVLKISSYEDTGTYRVLAYPDYFSAEIDRMIFEWFNPPQKRVRNRKKIVPTPEISVKPSTPPKNG